MSMTKSFTLGMKPSSDPTAARTFTTSPAPSSWTTSKHFGPSNPITLSNKRDSESG